MTKRAGVAKEMEEVDAQEEALKGRRLAQKREQNRLDEEAKKVEDLRVRGGLRVLYLIPRHELRLSVRRWIPQRRLWLRSRRSGLKSLTKARMSSS